MIGTAPDFLAHRLPSMAVACPDCHARVGTWCKRPSGHKAMGMHKLRHEEADRQWLLHDLPAITHRRNGIYVYDGPETRPSVTSPKEFAMVQRIGDRELQIRALREARAKRRPSTTVPAIAAAEPQEDTMTKNRKTKTPAKGRQKAKGATKKSRAPKPHKKTATPRQAAGEPGVPKETNTTRLTAFLKEPGGKVSADIEKKFGWLPHTARAAVSRLGELVKRTKDETRGTVYSIEA